MILSNDADLGKKFNSAVFPGLQGGPLMHVIAAKAVAFGEALKPEFKTYAKNVIENAKALSDVLKASGLDIVTGGTDTHLILVDLRPKGAKGRPTEHALDRAAITCNKNAVPFDHGKSCHYVRHPPGFARRHHTRFRRGGIPADRQADRGSGGGCRQE